MLVALFLNLVSYVLLSKHISLTLCPLWSLGSVKKFPIMRLVRIPGYNPFCRDRSGHSGGVLLYTRSHLTVKMLPCPHNGLEILPVVINCITVVYRPPRSQNSIFDSLCRFVASMNIHWCSHFLLLVILMSVVQLQHLLYHRVGSFIETWFTSVVRYFTLRAPKMAHLLLTLYWPPHHLIYWSANLFLL